MPEFYAPDGLDLKKIYDSGQCFRWRKQPDGSYLIPSAAHVVRVRQTAPDTILVSDADGEAYWRQYFDLGTDYRKAMDLIDPQDAFLGRAAEAGRGIRILCQDPWETLITFIISQRKNIPAIRTCTERLCAAAGSEGPAGIRCFPAPEEILASDAAGKLEACRLGYRLPYIRKTAETVASWKYGNKTGADGWAAELSHMDDEALLTSLQELSGVGVKVAKCVMLFGFHRLDAFPVDVWIRRALAEEYPAGFDFAAYHPYGGVIQQYIFAYYREKSMEEKKETSFHLRRLDRTLVYQGKILGFYQDTVELPDGKKERWDFLHHPTGGACVVAVLPDGRILMERQYRPSIDAETLELPAGARDSEDEDPRKTAKRELEEETGYTCGRLIFLAEIYSAPSWCDEKTDIYLARNVRKAEKQHLDEAEEIRLAAYPLKKLQTMIRKGEITDAKTVAGIGLYAARLAGEKGGNA